MSETVVARVPGLVGGEPRVLPAGWDLTLWEFREDVEFATMHVGIDTDGLPRPSFHREGSSCDHGNPAWTRGVPAATVRRWFEAEQQPSTSLLLADRAAWFHSCVIRKVR